MSTTTTLQVPAEAFALARTLRRRPAVAVEVCRVAAGQDLRRPYLRASGPDAAGDGLRRAIAADPTVASVEGVSGRGPGHLYRVRWTDRAARVARRLLTEPETVLSAGATDGRWRIRAVFPSRSALRDAYETWRGVDLPVTVDRIGDHPADRERGSARSTGDGLSDEQWAALGVAYDRGYYEVPREVHLRDLADVLDIASQSFSERLRRAHRHLVGDALTAARGDGLGEFEAGTDADGGPTSTLRDPLSPGRDED